MMELGEGKSKEDLLGDLAAYRAVTVALQRQVSDLQYEVAALRAVNREYYRFYGVVPNYPHLKEDT